MYNVFSDYLNFFNINLFKYITFRSFCALFSSFLICIFVSPLVIRKFHKWQKYGQPIREDGPETHFKKKGTPTMGGVIIILSTVLATLLWCDLSNKLVISISFLSIGFACVGFIDDYKKLYYNNTNGITARQKLLLQIIFASIFSIYIEALRTPSSFGILTFPFFKNFVINLGIFLPIFTTFVIVGSANAVNLTDGLDGLVIVPIIACAVCFGIFSYVVGHSVFANYLNIVYVKNAGELCILCSALIGAGLGFLWFNAPPAMIFMGDTGSLYIGAIISGISVIIKQEFLLAIAGGIFVLEAISVMIQVFVYKKTGKRVFLMTPIHHHFEKKGWIETTVVIRFWIISVLLAIIAVATLKIR